jgi:hypothetical protein
MNKERRSAIRFTVDQTFKLEFMHEEFVPVEGKNLSATGLLCNSDKKIDVGTRVFMMLTVNKEREERHISAEGVINRSKKFQHGFESAIQFTVLSPDDKSFLISLTLPENRI